MADVPSSGLFSQSEGAGGNSFSIVWRDSYDSVYLYAYGVSSSEPDRFQNGGGSEPVSDPKQ